MSVLDDIGNVAAYGLAIPTFGASLLGKKSIADGIGLTGNGGLLSELSGSPQARAARDAAKVQSNSANSANQTLMDIYQQNRADQMPFLQLGQQNATNLSRMTNAGAFNSPQYNYQAPQWQGGNGPGQFSFDASQVLNDPGYQFRLKQGEDQVQQSAAARGLLHSGGTLKGINDYAQGQASSELGNAYNRQLGQYNANANQYQNQRTNFNNDRNFGASQAADQYSRLAASNQDRFNRLSNLAGYGPVAASSLGNLGSNYGQNYGNNLMQAGNAQASGIIGQANAKTNAVNQGLQFVSGLAGAGAKAYAGGA